MYLRFKLEFPYVPGYIFALCFFGLLLLLSPLPTQAHTGIATKSVSQSTEESDETCDPTWSSVSDLPDVGGVESTLQDVVALSATDIWGVGAVMQDGSRVDNLAVHWDGTSWSVVDTPNLFTSPQLGGLVAADAVTPDDIWAVAYNCQALHYDGSSWEAMYLPCSTSSGERLADIVAVASNDVWIVGTQKDDVRTDRTLILHWNGTGWTEVASPNVNEKPHQLTSIAAVSANDIWAVGQYIKANTTQTLIMHWDGTSWSIVESPNPTENFAYLNAVEVVSANDVWAVGSYNTIRPMTLHWNGVEWTNIPAAGLSDAGSHNLLDVEALAPNDVWAVGNGPSAQNMLVMHWNGTSWEAANPPMEHAEYNALAGIDALGPENVWAVGWSGSSIAVDHYSSPCAYCALDFQDVTSQNTFYPFVNCLACRNILGGYPCGGALEPCNASANPYFRPGIEISRGQIAKIVAQAAGITDQPGPQIYADVAPSSPFYDFINRLSKLGHMSGYPCGTNPQEPCDGQSRPYFRPGAHATRGQLAKIVSNTAQFNEAVTGETYADVSTDAPFYAFIERLSGRGVMSGYACGHETEPCEDPPLPYFRPNSNVTRGQASKIVGNTFYPNCQPVTTGPKL